MGIDLTFAQGSRGGTGAYIRHLVRHLGDRDDLDLYTLAPGVPDLAGAAGVPAARRRRRSLEALRRVWATHLWLPVQLRDLAPAVVHAPAFLGPLNPPGALVLTIHDVAWTRYPRDYGTFWRWYVEPLLPVLIRRADAILTGSAASRAAIRAYYGAGAGARTRVIPYGVDPDFGQAGLVPGTDPAVVDGAARAPYGVRGRYFLHVGDWSRRKNLPRLIHAFARYAAATGDETTLLVLAGGGSPRPESAALVRRAIAASSVGRRIVTPGPIAGAHLPAFYRGAAAFVFPSLDEGFGLPVLEAMACGTPVLAARAGALPEIASEAALLLDPRDEAAWAAALARLDVDLGLCRDLATRGRARAAAFPWARTAALTAALYHELGDDPAR